jgi:hypothetical protein
MHGRFVPTATRLRDRAAEPEPAPYWLHEYTLEVRDPTDVRYVSPYEPGCRPTERYLAVHAPDGKWAIVDRRTGKLYGRDEPGGGMRYVYRADVTAVVDALNRSGVMPAQLSMR